VACTSPEFQFSVPDGALHPLPSTARRRSAHHSTAQQQTANWMMTGTCRASGRAEYEHGSSVCMLLDDVLQQEVHVHSAKYVDSQAHPAPYHSKKIHSMPQPMMVKHYRNLPIQALLTTRRCQRRVVRLHGDSGVAAHLVKQKLVFSHARNADDLIL
jgi:hypothetical protein